MQVVCLSPNPQPGESVFCIYNLRGKVAPLYPQAPVSHFGHLLRPAWAAVSPFFSLITTGENRILNIVFDLYFNKARNTRLWYAVITRAYGVNLVRRGAKSSWYRRSVWFCNRQSAAPPCVYQNIMRQAVHTVTTKLRLTVHQTFWYCGPLQSLTVSAPPSPRLSQFAGCTFTFSSNNY